MARTVLVDGEEYEVDDGDIISYEDPQPKESFSDSLYNSLSAVGQGLEQSTRGLETSALGLLDYGADALGYQDNAFDKLIERRKQEKLQARNPAFEGTGYQSISDITENIAPILGAGVATGGAALPAALGGLKGFSDQYQESQDNNQSFLESTAQAGVRGLGEGVSNAIEAFPLFKAGSALGRIAKSGLYGALGNTISEGSDLVADNAFKENPEWQDDLGRAAGLGLVTGGALGTAGEALSLTGAKTLGRNIGNESDAQINNFEQILNDSSIPLESNLDTGLIDTNSIPEVNKGSLITDSEIPSIQPKGRVVKDDFFSEPPILQQAKIPEQKGIQIPEVYNPRTPEEAALLAREKNILDNTDSYRPSGSVYTGQEVNPSELLKGKSLKNAPEFQDVLANERSFRNIDNEVKLKSEQDAYSQYLNDKFAPNSDEQFIESILNGEPPKFVEDVRNGVIVGEKPIPPVIDSPPIPQQKATLIAPNNEPIKFEVQKETTVSDFESPIKETGVNPPKIIESVNHVDPKTNTEILLPYDPQIKGRVDNLITDIDEVQKALAASRRQSQRGSFSNKPIDEGTPWTERTKGAQEYDPDGIMGTAQSTMKKLFRMPRTLSEKYPAFQPIYKAMSQGIPEHFGTKLIKFRESASTYFDLPQQERDLVNKFLQADRRNVAKNNTAPASVEQMIKAGLSENQIKAVNSVRKTMDDALDTMSDAWKVKTLNRTDISSDDKKAISEVIDKYVAANKGKGYVPAMRFGRFYLAAKDANGNLTHYAFRNSKDEIRALEKGLKQSDPSLKFEVGNRETLPDNMYEDLPADLGGYLFFLEQGKPAKTPKGIMQNFMQARHIDGADEDLSRSIATYLQGVSKYSARAYHDPIINKALRGLNETEPNVAKQAKKYLDDLKKPSSEANRLWNEYLVPFYNFQYLSGNVSNMMLNALEPVVSTYPQIGTYLRDVPTLMPFASERIAAKSLSDTIFSVFSKKTNPELAQALDIAKQSGFLDDSKIREIYDISRGRKSAPMSAMKKLAEVTSLGNTGVENLVKYYDFITGFNVAKVRGLSGEEAVGFAVNFTNDVKSGGRKADQNALFRNAPVVSLFRNYAANQYRQLNRALSNKDYGVAGKQVLGNVALAGAAGIPLAKEALSLYDMFSEEGDWKASTRGMLESLGVKGKLADTIIYGVPASQLGVSYSNTAGYANLIPPADNTNSVAELVGKSILGATYAPISQAQRGYQLYKSGRGDLAAERVMPILGRQVAKGMRTLDEGVTDAKGMPIKPVDELTAIDKLASFTNTSTLDLAKRYEERNLAYKTKDKATQESKTRNDNIFWAYVQGDTEKYNNLIQEAQKKGVKISDINRALKQRLQEYNNPTEAILKRVPKSKREEVLRKLERID